MAITVNDLNNRSVTTSTVGYMALALAIWMLSMATAGWYDHPYIGGVSLMTPFAVLLAIIGILAYLHGRTLDSIVFFAFSALFTAGHTMMAAMAGAGAEPMSYGGWFWIVWAVFFAYVWVGSFRAGMTRMLFLLAIWLSFLALAIHDWTSLRVLELIGGYLGLISAVIAAIVSASAVICFGREAHSPNAHVEPTSGHTV